MQEFFFLKNSFFSGQFGEKDPMMSQFDSKYLLKISDIHIKFENVKKCPLDEVEREGKVV